MIIVTLIEVSVKIMSNFTKHLTFLSRCDNILLNSHWADVAERSHKVKQ